MDKYALLQITRSVLVYLVLPLALSVLLTWKFPKRIFLLPFIAFILSLGVEYLFYPFHITDLLFGSDPNDDFAFTTVYWWLYQIFLYIPWCFLWVIGCKIFLRRNKKS